MQKAGFLMTRLICFDFYTCRNWQYWYFSFFCPKQPFWIHVRITPYVRQDFPAAVTRLPRPFTVLTTSILSHIAIPMQTILYLTVICLASNKKDLRSKACWIHWKLAQVSYTCPKVPLLLLFSYHLVHQRRLWVVWSIPCPQVSLHQSLTLPPPSCLTQSTLKSCWIVHHQSEKKEYEMIIIYLKWEWSTLCSTSLTQITFVVKWCILDVKVWLHHLNQDSHIQYLFLCIFHLQRYTMEQTKRVIISFKVV